MSDFHLTGRQANLLKFFYSMPNEHVGLAKKDRDLLWKEYKKNYAVPTDPRLKLFPALLNEIQRAAEKKRPIQSAVFSECVYAQTLANMLGLREFEKCLDEVSNIPPQAQMFIDLHKLKPRYIYKSSHSKELLIQAGGAGGVDSALVRLKSNECFTIEYKEATSKISEPDLPKYSEDGYIASDEEFQAKNSQFEAMLKEQSDRKLNIWEIVGKNVNFFDLTNMRKAVRDNYSAGKFADVICVEDKLGHLTMLPANQVDIWAELRGEIRSAGRNNFEVWTPLKLTQIIKKSGGKVCEGLVTLPSTMFQTSKKRGGNDDVSRYKINPLFFVRKENVTIKNEEIVFKLSDVRQNKPTISVHLRFKNLDINKVRLHYKLEL